MNKPVKPPRVSADALKTYDPADFTLSKDFTAAINYVRSRPTDSDPVAVASYLLTNGVPWKYAGHILFEHFGQRLSPPWTGYKESAECLKQAAKQQHDDKWMDGGPTKAADVLPYKFFSDIETEEIHWLWPNRYAIGKLGLIAGYPEDGKSTILFDVAARVTRGDEWPDQSGRAPKGGVIILSAEDDEGDTIKPRLQAAGADMRQLVTIPSIIKSENGGSRVFNIADDLARLKLTIEELRTKGRNVLLVILDPINSYLGGKGKADAWKTSDMRALLTPMKEWAAEVGVCVIGISHFSKHHSGRAIHKIVDSQAITAAARCIWITADEEATGRKLLLRGKVNIGPRDTPGVAYTVALEDVETAKGSTIKAPRIEWHETVTQTAEDVLGEKRKQGRPDDELADAIAFLEAELADGPRLASEVLKAGRDAGHTNTTLKRAKKELGVVSTKSKGEFDGAWVWILPDMDFD